MGYKLRREVRDSLPAGTLTAAERLLVLELADICGDDTREGWPGAAKLAELTDLSERSIQETLARIGEKWVELRVPLGVSTKPDRKTGELRTFTYYSKPGHRTVFRFPPLSRGDGAMDPGASGATDPGSSDEDGATDPGERCDGSVPKVRQNRGPSPHRTSQKINPSSLSPDVATESPSSARVEDRERDDVASLQEQNSEPVTPVHHLLIKNGCPADCVHDVKSRIDTIKDVRADGFYFTAHGNGSLAAAVAEALQDLKTGATHRCPDCNDTGVTGDYLNSRTCDCLWWKDPTAARKAFLSLLKDFPPCGHGMDGGDLAAPNGWQACSICRGPGWVDPAPQRTDRQPRSSERADFKPSTGAVRARQGLSVADELDRQNGHGRYAPGLIRSPADQRVADGAALYNHYKALEGNQP